MDASICIIRCRFDVDTNSYYIKSVAELRNVGDAAYAMSHAAAVA